MRARTSCAWAAAAPAWTVTTSSRTSDRPRKVPIGRENTAPEKSETIRDMTRVPFAWLVAIRLTVPVLVGPASAHHGAGRYDPSKRVTLEGKLTRLDFVNPHSYVYFDVTGPDGKVVAMKCEMRSATTLRRS